MGTAGAGTEGDGVVVLLFTDVVGSTRLLDRLGEDATEELRRRHFSLLREVVASTGGREVKSLGDGLMVAFASPVGALRCAVEMQRAIGAQNLRDPSRAVEIRIGLHLGDPPRDDDDYFGTPVVVARRLCDRAAGGQILASELLAGVAGTRGGHRFRRLGRLHLKGLTEPIGAVAVEWEGPLAVVAAPAPRSSRPTGRGPRLVGRDDELAVLHAELARSRAGEFRCVLLLGDAGIGKTRLAGEFLDSVADEVLALSARSYPFGQTVSFGLWSEALERHLRRLPLHEVAELCGGFLDDLAGLLRSVAAARGAAPEGDAPVLRLMDGLAALLGNLASTSPVVVAFDDVHLGDPSSWETLQYLAYNLSDIPLLVVASARPAELTEHPSAGQVVRGLEQDGLLRRFMVPPVDRLAVAELCREVVQVPAPEPLVEWVTERSKGNPLFALGLIRALVDEGGDLTAPRLRRLPEALNERVASRFADLDPGALEVVELLAVLARPLQLEELALLRGCAVDETAGIVHRLIRVRLVAASEGDEPEGYELAHPLLQEVAYDRIGPARRRALHRLAARSLVPSGRIAEAASHFARGADSGDPEAVDTLRDALRQAEERDAYSEALDILTSLVDLLPADDDRWLEVVDAFPNRARWAIDQRADVDATQAAQGLRAMRFLESVATRSPDPARQATVKHRMGIFLGWGVADPPEAVRLLREARDLFESAGDERSAAVTSGTIAHVHALAGNWTAMEPEAERAMGAAEALADPMLAGSAIAALFRSAGMGARFDACEAYGERLIGLLRSGSDSGHLTWALSMQALFRACEGRIGEIGPLLDEVRAVSQPWRPGGVLVVVEPLIHWLAGDVPRALDAARRFRALYPYSVSPRRGIGAVISALVALEADRPADAEDCLACARRSFGTHGFSMLTRSFDHATAVVAHRMGRSHEALTQLRETSRRQLADGFPTLAALTLLDQAELALSPDVDPEVAEEGAERLKEVAEEVDRDLYRGYAAFGEACSQLAAGRLDAARRWAEEAGSTFSELGYRLFAGRAILVGGRALARVDRPAAADAFERAVSHFDACGAVWRRDQARALLRALGGRGRKRAAAGTGPAALTRREREVAQLAAKGRTARQIAEELFVGERTVEGHLASVYTKLGISSKVDLARRASELGL